MSTNDTPAMYGPPQAFPPDWGKLLPGPPLDSALKHPEARIAKLERELQSTRAKSNRRKKALRIAYRVIVERTHLWLDACDRRRIAMERGQNAADQLVAECARSRKIAERVFEAVSPCELYGSLPKGAAGFRTTKVCNYRWDEGKAVPTKCALPTCPLYSIIKLRRELDNESK